MRRAKVEWLLRLMLILSAGALPDRALCGDTDGAAARSIQSETNLMALSFEELLDLKVDRVYGASRYEQSVAQAPAAVSIVTADEIKRYGHRTMADVLRSVRGLYVTDDRNYTYLGFRGFNRPGDYNSRVLMLIDGHRVNENIYDSVYFAQDALVDLDLVERVEIIRGPSSSIYGNNALFGVINVVTRRGGTIDGVETSAEAGSFDTYKARISTGKLFTNGVEFLVSGSVYTSEGQDRLFYPEFNSRQTQFGVIKNADDERTATFNSSLSYKDFTLSGAFNVREKNVPTAAYDSVFGDGRMETLDVRGYVDLKFERAFTEDSRLMARTFYDAYHYYGQYPYDVVTNILLYKDASYGGWVGTEAQFTHKVLDRHTLILGADYRENLRQDQFAYYDDVEPRPYAVREKNSSRNVGVYLQGEAVVRSNLLANVGVRYDYYSTFGGSVNPRVGVIYNPWQDTTLKLLYGRAFRAPNELEMHYYPLTGSLDPETIDTYEFIVEQKLPAHHKAYASAYYYDVRDLISQQQDTASGDVFFANVEHVRAFGIELEAEGRYPCGVLARASYALQRTEDASTGDELSNSPRHLAKLNLSVPVYEDKVFASLEVQYHGEVLTLSRQREGDFVLVNLTLFSQKLAKNLEASASIYNLFDTKYAYPGTEDHRQDVIPQDGRSFRIKLTWRF